MINEGMFFSQGTPDTTKKDVMTKSRELNPQDIGCRADSQVNLEWIKLERLKVLIDFQN